MTKRYSTRNRDLFINQLKNAPKLQLKVESTNKNTKSSSSDDEKPKIKEVKSPASSPVRKSALNTIKIFNRQPLQELVLGDEETQDFFSRPKEKEDLVSSFYSTSPFPSLLRPVNRVKRQESPKREKAKLARTPEETERRHTLVSVKTGTRFFDTQSQQILTYLTTNDHGLYVLMNEKQQKLITVRKDHLNCLDD